MHYLPLHPLSPPYTREEHNSTICQNRTGLRQKEGGRAYKGNKISNSISQSLKTISSQIKLTEEFSKWLIDGAFYTVRHAENWNELKNTAAFSQKS